MPQVLTPPDEIPALAKALGLSKKAVAELRGRHEDDLAFIAWLKLEWIRLCTEPPRFMAKQQGRMLGPQYVTDTHDAIDDAEAVEKEVQVQITARARVYTSEYERTERAKERITKAAEQLRGEVLRAGRRMLDRGEDPSHLFAALKRDLDRFARV